MTEQERKEKYKKKTNNELRKIISNGKRSLRTGITGSKASDAVLDKMDTAREVLKKRKASVYSSAKIPWDFQ